MLIPTATRHGCRFDFAVGIPDWAGFPFSVWHRLEARALRAASRLPANYGEPEGRLALREAIAGHISFARAIACTAEEIVVTAGAQQAFDLLARILVTPGKTTVAVEDPGYTPLRNVLVAAGAKIAPVPVDGEGLRVDRLPRDAKAVFVTPSHQFPLGVHLSLARRRALLDFAQARGAVVVEDDYDGEFRYAGKPLDALQTLDRHGAVFYVGTFSKSLFPALRLGFVIAPAWARSVLAAAKQLSDWHAPLVAQDTLAAFIAEGHLARHVRKMRRIYGERREILEAALARFCADRLRLIGIGAGLHAAARLDPSLRTAGLIDRAREASVALDPLQRFAVGGPMSAGVVFGYGAIATDRIREGVRLLAKVMG
jgi:GntR family transcriptional regulator/MocR family aminotransferase